MENLLSLASQFGAIGLVVLAAGWYIFRRDELHAKEKERLEGRHETERKELTDTLARQHSEALAMADKASKSLDNNTAIVTKLATMIESSTHNHR